MPIYPMLSSILMEAKAYALESIEHTMDYEGWEDRYQKLERIVMGNFAQLWVADWCRCNNVPHKSDRSSPYKADCEDLKIGGYSVDVKQSTIKGMWPQVSSNNDKSKVHMYVFLHIPKDVSYVEPIGAVSKNKFDKEKVKVEKGALLPGTKMTQRYGYSYFLSPEYLSDFEKSIEWMGRTVEKQENSNVVKLPLVEAAK